MKNAIIVILILICCWLGFMVYQSQNKEASVFEKQKECTALYPTVKEYIIDQEEIKADESIWWYSYREVNNIELWYNKKLDSCIAKVNISDMNYLHTDSRWEKRYELTDIQKIIDVTNQRKSLFSCEYNPNNKDSSWKTIDCRSEFNRVYYSYKD